MLRQLATAAFAIVLVSPLAAQDPKPPVDPDKKICRRDVATASIMAKRTCRTKAEWDAISAQSQKDRDRVIDQERLRNHVQSSR